MDSYEPYASRSPQETARAPIRDRPRDRERDRDDYTSADPYRDRRRSPDRRRGDRDRRRSRSPLQGDRYQPDRAPRDDYYRRDDHRDRRRASPQPSGIDRYVPGQDSPPPPALLVNPLPDPMKLDFQVGFTWFAEWWRTEQRIKEEKERQKAGKPPLRGRGDRESRDDREAERPKIQAAYDQYKENLQRAQAQSFVRQHKNEDWFQERYIPSVRDVYRPKLMEFRRMLFSRWESELSSGLFDDFTLEGIYKSESNGAGGVLEKEEGEASAAAEVLGVGDLLPSKGGDLRDPLAMLPTLLIKTIAPTVTREKFEEFAKTHLGDGSGGFMHLSLSDPNPLKKCHRMGWIMLNPAQEDSMEDVEQPQPVDGATGEAGETNGHGAHTGGNAAGLSEQALEKINGKTIEDAERGNFTVHCGVHRPPEMPRKKALWDLFSAPERIARDLELATRLVRKLDNELGDAYFGVAKIEARVHDLVESGRLVPVHVPKPVKDNDDMDADIEEGEEESDPQEEEDDVDDEEMLTKKKKLDLLVEYLRRVYNFCFFCVFESDSVHELQRKCPGGHLRRPRASLTSAAKEIARASANGDPCPLLKKGDGKVDEDGEGLDNDDSPVDTKKTSAVRPSGRNAAQLQRAYNWVKTFEDKVLQILEPENVNIRKLGGTPLEEGIDEELKKFVKQEDANKFRCKVPECTKLFKGLEFWRKHVTKRHGEWFEGIQRDVELVNIYVLDPAHIAPSRSDANSNGHFPLNNHAPNGTPRGFQLNQQFPMGFPMTGGVQGLPSGAAMFNGSTMLAAGAWGNGGNGAGLNGSIGPMRHGGRHGMNGYARMAGPYARNDGRGRVPSIGGPRGGVPSMGMEGGAGAMGPREAVVGRSLRSYEDLDADNGQGTSELNY